MAYTTYRDTSGSTAGELTFGGQDANHYKGNITWVPITAQIYYWQFLVDRYCIDIINSFHVNNCN